MLDELAPHAGFDADVAVLPITVAALMTTDWVARHLPAAPAGIERVILPGFLPRRPRAQCRAAAERRRSRGPKDLRDLPDFFGKPSGPPPGYGDVRHRDPRRDQPRPAKPPDGDPRARPAGYRDSGADVIDLGCDPGATWAGVGDAVRALRDDGLPRLDRQLQPGRGRRRASRPGPSWC